MAAAASPDRRSIAIDLLGGIWILPFDGGDAHAHHARTARSAPADLVARQPIDRVPGLRRWRLAHLRDSARRRRGEGDHQRRCSTIASRRGRTTDRASRSRRIATAASRRSGRSRSRAARCGRSAHATAGCRPGRRTIRRSRSSRRDAGTQRATPMPGSVGGRARTAASGASSDRYGQVDGIARRRPRGIPTARQTATSRSGALVLARRRRHGRWRPPTQDVFPFKPQWLSRRARFSTPRTDGSGGRIRTAAHADGSPAPPARRVDPVHGEGDAAAQHLHDRASRARAGRAAAA